MKILIIHNTYKEPGGEDSVFRAESELLSSYGHEISHLLYDNKSIESFFDKCLYGLKTIYNPDSAKALRLKIQAFHPDIIHIHNFFPIASPSILFVARKLGVPVIMTLHNYRLICPSTTLFFHGTIYEKSISSVFPVDAIWKGVYRNSRVQTAGLAVMTALHSILGTWRNKVDGYIALTQYAKEKFESSTLKISPDKISVKPNFVTDSGVGGAIREDFFLFVGRTSEEKGIRVLMNAARMHSFRLVIIGDGLLRELVEDSARHHSNIRFLGQQPKSVVMDHLKRCKALLLPSISHEGFPVTIVEAFSTGTPVIASDLGSIKEIIQDGFNGFRFSAGNHQDLVSKIKEMGEDQLTSKRMCDNARSSYVDHYTPAKNYAQLMGIYNDAVDRRERVPNKVLQLADV